MGTHRGDQFEEIINYVNQVYKAKEIALIQKIATPMKPVRRGSKIVSAYYEEKSTLDYIGVYRGIAIAFDSKETSNKNNFPLRNIKEHQVRFMAEWEKNGGVSFLLINFKSKGKVYRLSFNQLQSYWKRYKSNPGVRGMGSIPLEVFASSCNEIKSKNGLALDYLEGLLEG